MDKCKRDKRHSGVIEVEALREIEAILSEGKPARAADLSPEHKASLDHLMLLTMKPVRMSCRVHSMASNSIHSLIVDPPRRHVGIGRAQVIYAANLPDADLSCGNQMLNELVDFAAAENSSVVKVSAQV